MSLLSSVDVNIFYIFIKFGKTIYFCITFDKFVDQNNLTISTEFWGV